MLSNIELSPYLPARHLPRGRAGWSLSLLLGCALLAPACGNGGDDTTRTPPPPPDDLEHDSSAEALAAVSFFDDGLVHDVRLVMAPEDWQSIVDDSRGDEWRRPASRSTASSSRMSASGRLASHRASWERRRCRCGSNSTRFEGKKLGGVDEIKLSGSWDDPFLIRDRLAYWYYRQIMPAPREVAARLWCQRRAPGHFEIEEIWGRETLSE